MKDEDYEIQTEKLAEAQAKWLLTYYSELQKMSQAELERITGVQNSN